MADDVVVTNASVSDLPSWMELVREVEPLFGAMKDFELHAKRAILRGTALVAVSTRGEVLGAALLSAGSPTRVIRWLAVRESARCQGIGGRLLAEVLRRWPPPGDISVITFGPDVAGGPTARRLYQRFGFTAGSMATPGEDGSSRQEFVLAQPGDNSRH